MRQIAFSKKSVIVFILVLALILTPSYLVLIWHITHPKGYLKPGEATGGIHNLILMEVLASPVWTPELLNSHVAYLDENLEPQDIFFDGFLFLYKNPIDPPDGALHQTQTSVHFLHKASEGLTRLLH